MRPQLTQNSDSLLTRFAVLTTLLHRVDANKNIARFYGLWLQHSLFGEVLMVRC